MAARSRRGVGRGALGGILGRREGSEDPDEPDPLRDSLLAAAQAFELGLDGLRILTTRDPAELVVWEALLKKADKIRRARDRDFAIEVANGVAKALSG